MNIKHATKDRRISRNEQRRQILPNMVGQQKQRTLPSQDHADMRELVVGFTPNNFIHICRIKTSLWPHHMSPANMSGSSYRPNETPTTPSTSMHSISNLIICIYNLENIHVRRIQLHPRSESGFNPHRLAKQ